MLPCFSPATALGSSTILPGRCVLLTALRGYCIEPAPATLARDKRRFDMACADESRGRKSRQGGKMRQAEFQPERKRAFQELALRRQRQLRNSHLVCSWYRTRNQRSYSIAAFDTMSREVTELLWAAKGDRPAKMAWLRGVYLDIDEQRSLPGSEFLPSPELNYEAWRASSK